MPEVHGLGRARKLWVFSEEASKIFGPRMLLLDLDCIVTGSLDAIAARTEPLILWRCVPAMKYSMEAKGFVSNKDGGIGSYNTSIILTSTGALPDLWSIYLADTKGEEDKAKRASFGTVLRTERVTKGHGEEKRTVEVKFLDPGDDDQMIVSLYAGKPALFSEADGIYKLGRRGFEDKAKLPDDARLVFFNGSIGSNMRDLAKYEWVKEYRR
jgi:hypothetical protein